MVARPLELPWSPSLPLPGSRLWITCQHGSRPWATRHSGTRYRTLTLELMANPDPS